MPPRYLLDTDTCSYIGRRHPPEVLARFRELEAGEAALSMITYGELYFGAERSPMRDRAARAAHFHEHDCHLAPAC